MATKLYSRQGGNLQGIGIQQPLQPDMTKAKILGDMSVMAKEMADKNFALGKLELINSTIDNAYQIAPTDLNKFDELIQSNLQKSTADIPNKWREDVLLTAKPKVDAMRAKVIQNTIDKQDAELKLNATSTFNRYDLQTADSNTAVFRSLVSQDTDAYKAANAYAQQNQKMMSHLATLTDSKGNYIIGTESLRSSLANGTYGKVDTAKNVINELSLEELKKFDDTTLQDRAGFKKAYGITDKEYDDIVKYVAQRRKDMGDEEKRIVKAQTEMNLARMVQSEAYNEQELDDMDIPEDVKKMYKKAHRKYEGKINPILANDGFLAAFSTLESIAKDSESDDPNHNMELLFAAGQALEQLNTIANVSGLSTEKKNQLQRSLYETVASQEFANILKPIFTDSALYQEIQDATAYVQETEQLFDASDIKSPEDLQRIRNINKSARTTAEERAKSAISASKRNVFNTTVSANVKREMKKYATDIISSACAYAAAGNYEMAQKIISDGNRELIKLRYSNIITDAEWTSMENALKNNEPAIFNSNGQVWYFQGFDAKDAFFKTKI